MHEVEKKVIFIIKSQLEAHTLHTRVDKSFG